jgi:hypothetical protein
MRKDTSICIINKPMEMGVYSVDGVLTAISLVIVPSNSASCIIFSHNPQITHLPPGFIGVPSPNIPLSAPSVENKIVDSLFFEPIPSLVEDEKCTSSYVRRRSIVRVRVSVVSVGLMTLPSCPMVTDIPLDAGATEYPLLASRPLLSYPERRTEEDPESAIEIRQGSQR